MGNLSRIEWRRRRMRHQQQSSTRTARRKHKWRGKTNTLVQIKILRDSLAHNLALVSFFISFFFFSFLICFIVDLLLISLKNFILNSFPSQIARPNEKKNIELLHYFGIKKTSVIKKKKKKTFGKKKKKKKKKKS